MAEDFIPTSTVNYINKAKKDITKSLVGSLVKKYANEIEDGVKAGLSSKQIAENLRKKDSSIKSKTIANTLARTALHSSFAQGAITDMLDDETIVAFRFNAVNDSRTSDICESLDGKIISKDEVLRFLPPLHYNCRSVLEPIFFNEKIPEDKLINKNTYKTKEYQEKIEPLMKKQEAFLKYQKEDIESIVNETQQVIKEPEAPKVIETKQEPINKNAEKIVDTIKQAIPKVNKAITNDINKNIERILKNISNDVPEEYNKLLDILTTDDIGIIGTYIESSSRFNRVLDLINIDLENEKTTLKDVDNKFLKKIIKNRISDSTSYKQYIELINRLIPALNKLPNYIGDTIRLQDSISSMDLEIKEIGDIVYFDRFTSTSKDVFKDKKYTDLPPAFKRIINFYRDDPIVLHIKSKKGKSIEDIAGQYKDQKEILFNVGSKFKILDKKSGPLGYGIDDRVRHIYLEEVE